ncbi:hypothetical protein ANCDUO_24348 [Ancylostoma duodenale]|uniref:Uncharacterized protein n=1 Tax=Ancylostoma duodenale TaxID=51022 RepID=A0A0C2FL69_9BILA|nr:hypothetical protein ANCDUO_24348 [Ancylostoma duodenale]
MERIDFIGLRSETPFMDSIVRPLNYASPSFDGKNELPNSSEIDRHSKSSILSTESDAQLVNSCFYMQADALLSGVDPIEQTVGISEMECLALCARSLPDDFVKKSDNRVGGLPVVRLTSRGVQPLTALVQRLSLKRTTCPAHLILLNMA